MRKSVPKQKKKKKLCSNFYLTEECTKLMAKTNAEETNGGNEIKEKGSF
jgi:hypothetical protein